MSCGDQGVGYVVAWNSQVEIHMGPEDEDMGSTWVWWQSGSGIYRLVLEIRVWVLRVYVAALGSRFDHLHGHALELAKDVMPDKTGRVP